MLENNQIINNNPVINNLESANNSHIKIILVICYGNIFRSPITESLINQRLKAENLNDQYCCLSRGVQGALNFPHPQYKCLQDYEDIYKIVVEEKLRELKIEEVATHQYKPIDSEILQKAHKVILLDHEIQRKLSQILTTDILEKTVIWDIDDPGENCTISPLETINKIVDLINQNWQSILQN